MDNITTGVFSLGDQRVRTCLLLAAGTGSRLAPLTDITPKCLVEVNGVPMIDRLICSLQIHGFRRLIIVLGHQADSIREYLGHKAGEVEITYVVSRLYATTNNIYSLWLVRRFIKEPFMLIESDLVFEAPMLEEMLKPNRMAVAGMQSWMDGTTVTLDGDQQVQSFWCGDLEPKSGVQYKSVNIYSLSRLAWQQVCKRLDRHISADLVTSYYETVFAELTSEGSLSFAPVFFEHRQWCEIDTIADLRKAEGMLIPYPPDDFANPVKGSTTGTDGNYTRNVQ